MAKRHRDVVSGWYRSAVGEGTDRLNANRRRADQKSRKIDRVAGFSDDSATADFGIVNPMIVRNAPGVESNRHTLGVRNFFEGLPKYFSAWGKSPVEANGPDRSFRTEQFD